MIKINKLPEDQFYGIDYKTSYIVPLEEDDLNETYSVEKIKLDYYCTIENKMGITKNVENKDVARYYKLYKNGEVAREIELGDIVNDNEDFIYKVCINKDGIIYGKMIGDCVLFSDIGAFDYYTEFLDNEDGVEMEDDDDN